MSLTRKKARTQNRWADFRKARMLFEKDPRQTDIIKDILMFDKHPGQTDVKQDILTGEEPSCSTIAMKRWWQK